MRVLVIYQTDGGEEKMGNRTEVLLSLSGELEAEKAAATFAALSSAEQRDLLIFMQGVRLARIWEANPPHELLQGQTVNT